MNSPDLPEVSAIVYLPEYAAFVSFDNRPISEIVEDLAIRFPKIKKMVLTPKCRSTVGDE